jgi:hypothetical protein
MTLLSVISSETSRTSCGRARINDPESTIAAGKASTHASARLHTVDYRIRSVLAAMVPAMPEERTWVVLTTSLRMTPVEGIMSFSR